MPEHIEEARLAYHHNECKTNNNLRKLGKKMLRKQTKITALKSIMVGSCLAFNFSSTVVNAQEQAPSEQPQDEMQEVVVTGIISSLKKQLKDKRDANQIKDVISAEDIGKLPDDNLAEALQRITGVQISRDFGAGDGVSIRGLDQNRVEINGQSTMGSNGESRGISFNDLAPDAFSSIEVIKTPMASMTEGSLGGTINLKTRRALNSRGNVLSGRIQTEFVEDASATNTMASIFGSTRWDTAFGPMGITTSLTYQPQTRSRDTSEMRWKSYTGRSVTDASGTQISGAGEEIFAPQQIKYQAWQREQTRSGIVSGFQWRPSDILEINLDANYNEFDISTASNSVQATFNNGSTAYTNAVLTSNRTLLAADVNTAYGNTNGWAQDSDRKSYGFALGAKYDFDTLKIDITAGKSHGQTKQNNSFFSTPILPNNRQVSYALTETDVPTLRFTQPNSEGALVPIEISDIASYSIAELQLQDGFLENDNAEFKVDFTLQIDGKHLSSIQWGGRYAEREASRTRDRIPDTRANPDDPGELFQGDLVVDVPEIARRMIAFPSDFLKGFSGGSYDYLAPYNGDFWSNPEISELYGIDLNNDLEKEIGYGYEIKEQTNAGYIQANFESYFLDIPYSANIGLRMVDTDLDSSGELRKSVNGVLTGEPTSDRNYYLDALGSANIAFAIKDDFLLRLSAADVLSRPRIADLSASTKVNTGDNTGRAGNSSLEPFRARQYDISFEWYGSETDYLSAAIFYKDIESFIIRSSEERIVDGAIYDITSPYNGEGGTVKGFELAFTKTFGFLGDYFSGMGLTASYTYADSETPNRNIVTGKPLPLEDLSKDSYNLIGFYEYERFSARIAYNWRSEFLDKTQGFNQQPETERDRSQLDFSASYKLSNKIRIALNGINLSRDANDKYQLLEERDFKKTSFGRRYTLSLSARL